MPHASRNQGFYVLNLSLNCGRHWIYKLLPLIYEGTLEFCFRLLLTSLNRISFRNMISFDELYQLFVQLKLLAFSSSILRSKNDFNPKAQYRIFIVFAMKAKCLRLLFQPTPRSNQIFLSSNESCPKKITN